MRFKGPILSLVFVLMISGLTRADYDAMRSSLKITLNRLNQLKNELKTNPLHSSIETTDNSDDLSTSEDLDKSQLVQEVLSEDTSESQPTNSNLSVLQSLYVKSDRIIIYSIGDDPTIVVNSEKEPGITHITLQGVQLDPRFKLFQNANQSEPSIGFVQVNAIAPSNPEDMATASVEIAIKTDHKNWQLSPRQGGFLINKLDSPINSDISSTTIEQTPIHSDDQNIPLTKNELTQSENLPEDHQPQVLAENPSQVTLSSSEPDEIQPQINPENTNSPEINTEISEPKNINISVPINEEDKTLELSSPLTPLQLPPTKLINLETANVLPQGSILTTYGSHIFSKGQYGGGTGLQTYNISIEGGVTDELQLGLDWVLFDDKLGEQINDGIPNLGLMSFAPKFKYQFLKTEDFSMAVSGSLEIAKFTGSYGLYTPNNLQQTTTTLAGTLQFPFTYNITSNLQWHLVPGVIFFPNTINNGGNFYGSLFNIGTGFNYSPLERLMLFADVNFPIGSGGNAVNNQGQVFSTPVWAAGLTFLQSPTVGVDLYATNAFGATPATQILAFIPNGGQVAAGVNIRYTPDIGQNYASSFRQGPPPNLSARDRQLLFNGINLSTAETLPAGMASIQGGSGDRGSFQLSYGMSDDAQLQITGQQISNSNTILSERFQLGGAVKLRFLSQTYGDPISLSLIGGFEEGTSEDAVGLFTAELAFLYQLSPQFAVTFNPKAAFFGSDDILGTGFGLNFQPFTGVQFIGEVTPILTGNNRQTIWSTALRYIHPEWNAGIDLYATNGAGTYGVGGLIPQADNHVNVGFNLLWSFGGNSQKKSRTVSSISNASEPLISMSSFSESKVEESPLPENLTQEQNSSKAVMEANDTEKLSIDVSENLQMISSLTGNLSSEKPEDVLQPQESRKSPKAGSAYITFSPVSWHLDDIKSKVSNFPLGLGMAYDFAVLDGDYGFFNWFLKDSILMAEFNVFRDSDFGYPAVYAAVSKRQNIFDLPLQMGTAVGLIYTTQLQELSGSPILPLIISSLQTNFDFPINLRLVYIPSISDFKSQQAFFTFFTKVN